MTNLQNHVVSLDLAKQLKEAGYPQEGTLFYWAKNPVTQKYDVIYYENRNQLKADFVDDRYDLTAAPLASELGEQLPRVLEIDGEKRWLTVSVHDDPINLWCVFYNNASGIKFYEATEADARAKMWLYLKEEGLLDV